MYKILNTQTEGVHPVSINTMLSSYLGNLFKSFGNIDISYPGTLRTIP